MYCFLFDYPKLNNDTKRGCHFNVPFGLYTTYKLQNYALKLVYTKKFSPYSLDLRFINSARLRNACFTLLYQGKYVCSA